MPNISNTIHIFANAGGIFVILLFVHFMADFMFQSYKLIDNPRQLHVELISHSFLYTVQFVPIMVFLRVSFIEGLLGLLWLFVSHFIIDSMWVTNHWIKYMWRPPVDAGNMALNSKSISERDSIRVLIIDHVQHAAALWPIVVMVLY